MKDERYSCKKAIRAIHDQYIVDPLSNVKGNKKEVIVEKILGPNLRYVMDARSYGYGILFSTRFGIRVVTAEQAPLLSVLNRLNASYIRGKFYVSEENELVFENFLHIDGRVSRKVLLTEMALGVKMFMKDMSDIVGSIKPETKTDGDYTIVEKEEEEGDGQSN